MSNEPLRIVVVLSGAFSNIVLASLLEPLRVARDSHNLPISWSFVTWDDRPVASSSGMCITPDRRIAEINGVDLALIVGGDTFRRDTESPLIRSGLRALRPASLLIGADTGAWLMASCGMLDGRTATVHWQLLDEFAEVFPSVVVSRRRYACDGRYWTCGSAASALELVLHFIDTRFGPAIAHDSSAMFLDSDPHDPGRSGALPSLVIHGSGRLQKVLQLMAASVEEPLTLADLARRSQIPQRTISRIFVQELGMSPIQYYQTLRLSRARDLVTNTDLTRQEIALRCGFATTSGLRRAFRKRSAAAPRR